jgi:hypothetical protein
MSGRSARSSTLVAQKHEFLAFLCGFPYRVRHGQGPVSTRTQSRRGGVAAASAHLCATRSPRRRRDSVRRACVPRMTSLSGGRGCLAAGAFTSRGETGEGSVSRPIHPRPIASPTLRANSPLAHALLSRMSVSPLSRCDLSPRQLKASGPSPSRGGSRTTPALQGHKAAAGGLRSGGVAAATE